MSLAAAPRASDIIFELCAESLDACLLARSAGVDRIELCADLQTEGLTASHGLLQEAVRSSGLPVYALLRPRGGDFHYSPADFSVMRQDLLHARELGVAGFTLGVLLPDGRVDIERTRDLVELAGPLEVTFHRAFDATPDLLAALEDVIATGCRRILTSGGAETCVAGAPTLRTLVQRAAGRIAIAVGGGLRDTNAAALVPSTGATHFHGSVRYASTGSSARSTLIDPLAVARLVEALRAGSVEALRAGSVEALRAGSQTAMPL